MSIVLAMIMYLIPFLLLQIAFRPFSLKFINFLEVLGMVCMIMFLLDEMIETIRFEMG